MPRKRLREDWLVRVYKFHATPVGELPQQLWLQARAMQALWNRLVELREAALERSAPFNERVRLAKEAGDKAGEKAAKEERAALWKEFEASLVEALRARETKADLGWEAREWVYDRFRTASSAALKRGGRLKFKGRLEQVVIPHRYTDGGVPVEKLFVSRRGKVRLNPLDPDVYAGQEWQRRRARVTRGVFGLSVGAGEAEAGEFAFVATLHREVPSTAVLKTASWCGRRHPVRGWQWTLQLSVELPPDAARVAAAAGGETPEVARQEIFDDSRPSAGIDLGWRKMDGYLRVGVLHGSDGRTFELRLPLSDTAGKDARRINRMIARHAAREGRTPELLPTTLADVWELQSKTDLMLEETKAGVRELLTAEMVPEEVRGVITNMTKVRNGGLVRLLRALREVAGENGGAPGVPVEVTRARDLLGAWLAETDRARKRISDTRDRLLRRRRWYYENVATWLAASYGRVAWEDDLGLKEMAEEAPKLSMDGADAALKLAAKYRGWASLSELRQAVRRRAQEMPGWLVKGGAYRSTIECEVCGEECEPTSQLMVKCPRGHRADQDVRAAKNLLAQITGGETAARFAGRSVSVPDALRAVVVEI
jgi:hypothetical protein